MLYKIFFFFSKLASMIRLLLQALNKRDANADALINETMKIITWLTNI